MACWFDVGVFGDRLNPLGEVGELVLGQETDLQTEIGPFCLRCQLTVANLGQKLNVAHAPVQVMSFPPAARRNPSAKKWTTVALTLRFGVTCHSA